MQISRQEEIDKRIPDKNLQNLIFNFDGQLCNFLTDDTYCFTYLSNTLIVSSLMVMSAFLNWKQEFNQINRAAKDKAIERFSNSMIRIYSMLDRAYDSVKVDSDFIDNLINNLYIDSALNVDGFSSFLETVGMRNFFNLKNNNLTKYLHMLKQKKLSTRMISNFGFDELCECFDMFPYLTKAKCIQNEFVLKKGLLNIEFDFEERYYPCKNISFNYSIVSYFDSYYYMEDFQLIDNKVFDNNNKKEQVVFLNFLSLDKADQFRIVLLNEKMNEYTNEEIVIIKKTAIEKFLIDYDIINCMTSTESYFFKDYIFLNNNYIKYLSLTIADTISLDTKKAILQNYREKYKNIFDKMYVVSLYNNCNEIVGYRWDEIIMFLLLEEGIYSCLQFLLTKEKYSSFINSLRLRFGTIVQTLLDENDFFNNPTYNLRYKNSKTELNMQTKSLILLATKLLTVNKWDISRTQNPATIDDIILELKNASNSNKRNCYEKNAYYINILINTLLFIDTFYKAIFEYARCKKLKELAYDRFELYSANDYKSEKSQWIEEMQRKMQQIKQDNSHFGMLLQFNGTMTEYYSLAKTKVVDAFGQLLYLNNQLSKRNFMDNEILFDALGRRSLFNSNDIQNLRESIVEQISNLEKNDNKKQSNELQERITSCLSFLKEGNQTNDCTPSNILFPIIGHYSNGVTSRDGYKYSYFYVDSYESFDNQTQIKMITEDDFEFGESYYCVPNVNRVAQINQKEHDIEHIWISPIIIPCSVFSRQVHASFVMLDDEADFDKAIELLYNVDKSIYGNLFGNLENAKTILPLLLNNPKSIFYKNYYYIFKIDNKIVAIASLYGLTKPPQWDTDLIEMAFRECKVEIGEKTIGAYSYFKDTFNDFWGDDFTQICDLCVAEPDRNKGIGKTFLNFLIKKAESAGKSTIITVYGDNSIACNLYFSMGFVRYASDCDTRGTESADHFYFKMLKGI